MRAIALTPQSPAGWASTVLYKKGYRYQIHALESAAGLAASDLTFGYEPGDARRYGYVGDGVVDDLAALVKWAKILLYFPGIIYHTDGGGLVSDAITLPAGAQIEGAGWRPLIVSNAAGKEIFSCVGTGAENLAVRGIRLQGSSASTVPLNSHGGFAAANTGLITAVNLSDVHIDHIDASTFYNPISAMECTRLWVRGCRATDYLNTGILAADSTLYTIDDNRIDGCTQAGATVAYGVQATGDQAGGHTMQRCSISKNRIDGINSWDGIGSHDVKDLIVEGNVITACRQGIDLGHLVATNVVANLIIVNNFIQATGTDTWGGAAAEHAGIAVAGFNAANRVDGVTVANNVIRDFFTAVGLVGGGFSSNIAIAHAQHVNIANNTVIGAGANASDAGIYITGTLDQVTITGNSLEGEMSRAAIRVDAATIDSLTCGLNLMRQSLTTDDGFLITTSTISQLTMGPNNGTSSHIFNSDIDSGGSTVTLFSGKLTGSFSAQIADGVTTSGNFTISYSVENDEVTFEIPAQTIGSTTGAQPFIQGIPAFLQPVHDAHVIGVNTDGVGGATVSKLVVKAKAGGSGGQISLFFGCSSIFASSGNKGVNNSQIKYSLNN